MEQELEQIEKELQIYANSDEFQNNKSTVQKLSQLEDTIEIMKSQLRSTTITDQRDVKLDIYGRVTKQVVDGYYQCQTKMILAPSPLEFLHNQLCDWHVFRDNQKIYKEIPECQMLRSKSVGKSQLQSTRSTLQYNAMFPVIAQIGDIITAYGSMTGFKPILPKGPNINFQQIYDLVLKITPKHCMGVTLDFPQCQKLLNDSGVTQSIGHYNKLQIVFQRAAFLQTQLFQKITLNNSNTLLSKVYQEKRKMTKPQFDAFHYGQVRRLGYIGVIYLFYAIAEEIYKQQALQISYKPEQLTDPYGEYQHSPDCTDYNKMLGFVNSWKILHRFGQILDESICTQTTSCRSYGLLKPKQSLMPDLYRYPTCIQVFTRYVNLIKTIFNSIPTESQLIDYNYLYKLCAIAGIHQQLSRDFCFEVVLRLFTKVDKATFIPGLDEDEFLVAIFVCANHALYREPFVLKLKRPEDRLEYTLEKLRLNV